MDRSNDVATEPSADSLRRLCAAAAAGDEHAFARLHARLANGLRRFVERRTGRRADIAEDIVQRTWLAVWDALRRGRYDPQRAAFTTFLYGIAYKQWLQHVRAARPSGVADELDELGAHLFGHAEPDEFLHACELLDAVRACLNGRGDPCELSDEERSILLGVARGQSERELAQRLRVAPSTINARKRAAFEKVRRYLSRGGHILLDE